MDDLGALNEHLWDNMILLSERYRKHEMNFERLVNELQSALDASYLSRTNPELVEQWYQYWTPLKIALADLKTKRRLTGAMSTSVYRIWRYFFELTPYVRVVVVRLRVT